MFAKRGLWCTCAGLALAAALAVPSAAKKKPSAAPVQQPADSDQANKGSGPGAESVRDKDDPRARAHYLETRRSGGQPVPRSARLRAMREQQQMMVNEGKAFWDEAAKTAAAERSGASPQRQLATPESNSAPPPLSSTQWVFIGPQPTNPNPANGGGGNHFSGRVTALAVDPSDATGKTVYLGAAQGGVWKTTDGGVNWTPLTDNQPSLAVGSIVLDPQNPQIVYVGTGEENFGSDSYYGVGILKSTNGGATWSNVAGSNGFLDGGVPAVTEPECTGSTDGIASPCGGLRIGSLAASVQGGVTVLLAAVQAGFSNTGGLYRSINGGGTWNLVAGIPKSSGVRYTADSVVFTNSSTAYAGIHGLGVFKSTDGGATFTAVNNSALTTSGTSRVSLAAATSDTTGNTVYAALEVSTSSNLSGLYKTTNGGTNWTKLTSVPDFCGTQMGAQAQQCFYDMLVSVSPIDSNVVFVGGAGFPLPQFVLHTTNGGANWIDDSANIHADQHAGAFTADGGTFYIGNDGGAYKASGIGGSAVTWTELNTTLGITQFYSYFSIDPVNSQLTYAGTQDNGTQRFSGDLFWDELTCGDGAGAVIDHNTGRIFANCNDIDVRESVDGSPGSFTSSGGEVNGIPQSDTVAFIPPMIGDNSSPQNLYFGTNKIYRAISAPTLTWSIFSGVLTNGGSNSFTNVISNMDISPDNTTMFVVSGDGQVSKSSGLPNSPNFSAVTSSGYPAGNFITSVRISPTDNNTAYIGLAGFNAGQHIFKSIGGGAWTNISGNLPNTPVNDLVLDPDIPGVFYAATDTGVYTATDNGISTTWTTLQTMLPKVAVLGLRLHRGSRTLRAATHGRGMWDLYVPACNPSAGPCLQLSPPALNFGTQPVGTASSPQAITITNIGNATLNVGAINLGGPDYVQSNNCHAVAQAGTCTITVTFTPRDGLTRNGSLTIYSDGGKPATASLTGIGLVIPTSDAVATGITVTSLPFTATVINNGATSDSTDPVPPPANNVEDGTIKNCVGGYAPNTRGFTPVFDQTFYDPSLTYNHHSIWFTYTPQTSGSVDIDTLQSAGIDTVLTVWTLSGSTFTLANNGSGCDDDTQDAGGNPVKQSKLLSFPVVANTTYHIMVAGYYSNDFGAVVFHMAQTPSTGATGSPFTLSDAFFNYTSLVNRPSPGKTEIITNSTTNPVPISSVTVTGDYSVVANGCPATLGAGLSCNATVVFNPMAVGQRNGVLTVTDGASGSPQTVPLTGFAFDFNLANPRASRPSRSTDGAQGQVQKFELALNTSTGGVSLPVTLSCADAPPGSTCTVSPSQVNAGDGSTPITVILQTSAGLVNKVSARTRRLGVATGGGSIGETSTATPVGSYNLKVTAHVGDVETTTLVPVTVVASPRAARISH